jgi:hypothetical protein
MKIFIAHRKDADDSELNTLTKSVEAYCARGTQEAHIFLGRDDYRLNFKQCGKWDTWIENVIVGRDPTTTAFRYDIFIVPDETVGAATAKMIDLALRNGRKIYYWAGDRPLRIRELKVIDTKNFKRGWSFIYEQ